MAPEHREFTRAPLTGPVRFFEWNEARSADAVEISASGIFLKTTRLLAEGSMLTLRLTLPGLRRAFTVLGKVVRTVKGGLLAPAGMGVRFMDLQPADREIILAYVARRVVEAA
jgi:type IV pilus assembly protein PilZ